MFSVISRSIAKQIIKPAIIKPSISVNNSARFMATYYSFPIPNHNNKVIWRAFNLDNIDEIILHEKEIIFFKYYSTVSEKSGYYDFGSTKGHREVVEFANEEIAANHFESLMQKFNKK